jgi:protein transport protein SEC24
MDETKLANLASTNGLAIHAFHGNLIERSADIIALPNINPDSCIGMQLSIKKSLSDLPNVCFQAVLNYTTCTGVRRITIHTYCMPVTKKLNELINCADQECIIGLVSKMAVDMATFSSVKDTNYALINIASDYLKAFSQLVEPINKHNSLISPNSLRCVPLMVLALMKNVLIFSFIT